MADPGRTDLSKIIISSEDRNLSAIYFGNPERWGESGEFFVCVGNGAYEMPVEFFDRPQSWRGLLNYYQSYFLYNNDGGDLATIEDEYPVIQLDNDDNDLDLEGADYAVLNLESEVEEAEEYINNQEYFTNYFTQEGEIWNVTHFYKNDRGDGGYRDILRFIVKYNGKSGQNLFELMYKIYTIKLFIFDNDDDDLGSEGPYIRSFEYDGEDNTEHFIEQEFELEPLKINTRTFDENIHIYTDIQPDT